MSHPVFISYARSDSAHQAQALAASLNGNAFFDIRSIDDGAHFPQALLDALLAARVVVIFASESYLKRRFCRAEMQLALEAGDADASHIVLALGEKSQDVLDAMPEQAAVLNWPPVAETARLVALIANRLASHPLPLGERIPISEAEDVAEEFLQDASIPAPRSLSGILVSFPPGLSPKSIRRRFVGRAGKLRNLHRVLAQTAGGAICLSSRITAGAGFGKTRLAIEYVHRYGGHYPGGIFWVNAASSTLEEEFWRILRAIDPSTLDIAILREQKPSIPERLGSALRGVEKPVLYVVDNIPEAGAGGDPLSLKNYCPALGAVSVLATSRQNIYESGIETIRIDQLDRASAVLLLRKGVQSARYISREEWGRIADWVGCLPVVLDLLNRVLASRAISPKKLLERCDASQSTGITRELDQLGNALRRQVPREDLVGITAALQLSYEKLDLPTQTVVRILAPTPIPEDFFDVLPDGPDVASTRSAVQSRHFVTSTEGDAFGVMHLLTADFLRSLPEGRAFASFESACRIVADVMTYDRCRNPKDWPLMELCRPHAEVLFERGRSDIATSSPACDVGSRAAELAHARGDYRFAIRLQEDVYEERRRVLGEDHPTTLASMNALAQTLRSLGRDSEARDLHGRVVDRRKLVLGEEHPDTLTSISNFAAVLDDQVDFPIAEELHEHVLEVRRRVLGEENLDTLAAMSRLAYALASRGNLSRAAALEESVVELRRRLLGEEHPDTLTAMDALSATYRSQGKLTEAKMLQERVFEIRRSVLSTEHPDILRSMNHLVGTLGAMGDYSAALTLAEHIVDISKHILGEEHPDTLTSMSNLAEQLRFTDDLKGAHVVQEQVYETRKRILGEAHPSKLCSKSNLAVTLYQRGAQDTGVMLLRECLEQCYEVYGVDHPETVRLEDIITAIERELCSFEDLEE